MYVRSGLSARRGIRSVSEPKHLDSQLSQGPPAIRKTRIRVRVRSSEVDGNQSGAAEPLVSDYIYNDSYGVGKKATLEKVFGASGTAAGLRAIDGARSAEYRTTRASNPEFSRPTQPWELGYQVMTGVASHISSIGTIPGHSEGSRVYAASCAGWQGTFKLQCLLSPFVVSGRCNLHRHLSCNIKLLLLTQ